MKALALCLLLAGCAAPHSRLVWTENGFMPYDAKPGPRQQRAYNDVARRSMGISKAEWDAAQWKTDPNQAAWEAKHPLFAPRSRVHDRTLEVALSAP